MKRGLVLNAIALDAAGEIKQRFFLVDVGQRVGNVGEGKELAVGIDVVVLRSSGVKEVVSSTWLVVLVAPD